MEEAVLEAALGLVEQGAREPGAVAEAPEQRPLAHPGRGGDGVHRDVGHAVGGEQPLRRAQHRQPVAARVGALDRLRAEHRELGGGGRDGGDRAVRHAVQYAKAADRGPLTT